MFETIKDLDRVEVVKYLYCLWKRPQDLVKFLSLRLYTILTND